MYLNCAQAIHTIYRECGPPGTQAYDRCMKEKNVHLDASSARGECRGVVVQCDIAGYTTSRYACVTEGDGATAQTVHGLPLHGAPTRVTGAEKSS